MMDIVGCGIKATQIRDNDSDKIVIQSGGSSLIANPTDSGHGFGNLESSGAVAELQYRLIVIRLD